MLHFNENINRQTKTAENGEEYFRVTYPKFKLGDEVVREVAVPPTYGKLSVKVILCFDTVTFTFSDDLFSTFMFMLVNEDLFVL